MKQVWAIATTTLGEAIRRRVLLVILLVGVAFIAIAPGLGVLSARSETTVLRSMLLSIIQLTSAVIAVVLTVYMIPNEIERRTIYTILSKPVHRWQFLIGKYLGAVLALMVMMALMTGVLCLAYFVQQGYRADGLSQLLRAPIMFFVQMCLLAAVGVFFSTFVTPLVNFFLSGAVFLVGTTFSSFFESMLNNPSSSNLAKGIGRIVNTLLPNFAYYNVQNPLINPTVVIQDETQNYIKIVAYGVLYIGVLLVAGILVFDRREV